MRNQVWKTFAAQEVSHSVAHYLATIHDLHESHGYARISDVARVLELTKGSVSVQMKHLKEKGFVEEDENRFLRLTSLGETVVSGVRYNRQVIVEFLSNVLGVNAAQAETDACKIEHLLSHETCRQIRELVEFLDLGRPEVHSFLEKFRDFRANGTGDAKECPGAR